MDFKEEMKAAFIRAPVAALWKTRFHRADKKTKVTQTKGWMFFLSRPALELCRKMDKNTERVLKFLQRQIELFLQEHQDAEAWIKKSYKNKMKIETKVDEERYLTFIYPFSLENEVAGKHGVFIHIGTNQSKTNLSEKKEEIHCDTMPTMFEEETHPFYTKIRKDFQRAPGTEWSDPMWSEFSGSKVLPTDILLKPCPEDSGGTNWKEFNRVIGYQFIEIRLLNSPGDEKKRSSGEQIEALGDFAKMDSGFINFSGAPGTGKSTMLHMVCADRLAKNWAASEGDADSDLCNKIMYYVPSRALQLEASREIEAILRWVYRLDFDAAADEHMKNLHLFTPADLYATKTLAVNYNLMNKGADVKLSEIRNFSQVKDEELSMFKTHLRRLIFGVFETPSEFFAWEKKVLKKIPGKEEKIWTKNALNLQNPRMIRGGRKHDFHPNRFLPYDELKSFNKKLDVIKDQLHTSDKQQDVFWDSSSMITVAAKAEKNWTNTPWSALKGKIDYFVVDEIQDFTISEIRSLINHFSNRQDGQVYRNFRFICAGDENQNVRHLIYIPRNDHFRGLYEDWWLSLNNLSAKSINKKTGNETTISLAHDLDNRKATNFLSSYRVFDEMLPHAQQILDKLESLYDGQAKGATIEKTVFGRSGVLVVPTHRKKTEPEDEEFWKKEILSALRKQLECDEENLENKLSDNPLPIQVSLSYSNSDVNPDWAVNNVFRNRKDHPLSSRLIESQKRTAWHEELNELLGVFKGKFLQRIDEVERTKSKDEEEAKEANLLREWEYELESRGIFSSQGIKGLTLPISIILPATNLSRAEKNHTAEALCEYLVQLTRAQYVNVLLDPPNFVSAKTVNTEMEDSEKELWLQSVLRGATGYEDTLERIYTTALKNNTNILRWERLLARARNSDNKELLNLMVWMKKAYSKLNKGSGLSSGEIDELFISGTSSDGYKIDGIKLRKDETDDQTAWKTSLATIRNLEQYPLSGTRFNDEIIASLILFFAINNLLRQPQDGVTTERVYLENALRTSMNSIHLTDTKHWLELINDPEDDTDLVDCSELLADITKKSFTTILNLFLSNLADLLLQELFELFDVGNMATLVNKLKELNENPDAMVTKRIASIFEKVSGDNGAKTVNKIRSLLNTTFRINNALLAEDWTWPSPALPRLFLGSWDLSNPGLDERGEADDEFSEAWISSDQAYYTIPKSALYRLLNLKEDSVEKSHLLKVRMMISMNTLDHETFLESLKYYIDEQYRQKKKEAAKSMWDWFFSIMNHESCPAVFKSSITKRTDGNMSALESMLSTHINARTALAESLEESKSIGDFVTKLNTLDLIDWANISMPKITQKIVEKAYDYIKSTDRFVSVNAQLESIQQEINDLNKNRKNLTENEYDEKRGSLNQTKKQLQQQRIDAERLYKAEIQRTDGGEVTVAEKVFESGKPIHNLLMKVYSKDDGEDENGRQSIRLQQRMFEVLSKMPQIINARSYQRIATEKLVFPSLSSEESSELFRAFIGCLDYWTVYTPPEKEIKDEMKNLRRNDSTEKAAKVGIAKRRAKEMVNSVLSTMKSGQEEHLTAWLEYIVSANKLSRVKAEGGFMTPTKEVRFLDALHNEFRRDTRFQNWVVDKFLFSEEIETTDSWKASMTSLAATTAYACLQEGQNQTVIESKAWDKDNFNPNFPEMIKPDELQLLAGVQIPWTAGLPDTSVRKSESSWQSRHMIHGISEVIIHQNIDEAIELFEECRAYNHSTALRLHHLFENNQHGEESFERNFIRTLLDALRRERRHLLESTFLAYNIPGGTSRFERYRYGAFIVQEQAGGKREGRNTVQHIFDARPAKYRVKNSNGKYDPNKHKDFTLDGKKENQARIDYLALHDAFENMERLADMIEERFEEASSREEFLAKLGEIELDEFTTFKNTRKMKFTWTWSSRGYEPKQPVQDRNIPKIIDFIQKTLGSNDLSKSEFSRLLVEITGLKGMLRDYISPPMESSEAIERREEESENLLQILHQNFIEIVERETNEHDINALDANKKVLETITHLTKSEATHDLVDHTIAQLQGVNVQQAIREEWRRHLKQSDLRT